MDIYCLGDFMLKEYMYMYSFYDTKESDPI